MRQVTFFPCVRDQHSIGTRSSEYDVVVPRVQGPDSSTFAFTAANLWNALPDIIQSIDTLGSFRRAVYMFLVRNYAKQIHDLHIIIIIKLYYRLAVTHMRRQI